MKRLAAMSYFGGKHRMAPWIVGMLADHDSYVEPFCGMMSVLLNKPKSHSEIFNDLDSMVYNWWIQVRDNWDEFSRKLFWTPHSQEQLTWAIDQRDSDLSTDVDRAVAFSLLSRHTIANNQRVVSAAGWRYGFAGVNGDMGSLANLQRLERVRQRIISVQLMHTDALKCVERALCADTTNKAVVKPVMIYRLSPAYAGSIIPSTARPFEIATQPRLRGEYDHPHTTIDLAFDSAPLTRGAYMWCRLNVNLIWL